MRRTWTNNLLLSFWSIDLLMSWLWKCIAHHLHHHSINAIIRIMNHHQRWVIINRIPIILDNFIIIIQIQWLIRIKIVIIVILNENIRSIIHLRHHPLLHYPVLLPVILDHQHHHHQQCHHRLRGHRNVNCIHLFRPRAMIFMIGKMMKIIVIFVKEIYN